MNNSIKIIVFVITLISWVNAQPKLDSLLNSINGLENIKRAIALSDLCWEYRSRDPEIAIKYGLAAIEQLEDDFTTSLIPKTYNFLGVIYGNLGKLDSAFYFYNLAISTAREIEDSIQIAYSLNNIGDYYFKNALYSIALENIFEANEIFEHMGDNRGVAYTLNDIGEIYLKQKDYDKALEYFLKSELIRENNNDKRGLAKSLINQAAVYVNKGLDDEALKAYDRALKLSDDIDYVKGKSWVLAGIADIYYRRGDYDKALKNRMDALNIDLEIGNKYGELINYNQIGLIYSTTGKIKLAEQYLSKAKSESGRTGHLEQLMTSYNYLKNLYLKKREYDNAFRYQASYEALKDSIFSHESVNRIADLQTAFLTERKERENELLKKDIDLQQVTRNYFLLIIGLIVIASFVIVSKYKSERRSNKLLKETNIQKDKIFSIISHDLKNPAGAINNFLELMHVQYDSLTDADRKEFIQHAYNASDVLVNLLMELLEWGRLSRGIIKLNPENVNLKEIVNDIFKLLNSNAVQKNIRLNRKDCDVNIKTDRNMLNTVLRNFVNNAIKFTPRNGSITVSFTEDEKFYYISTTDSGIGIEPDRTNDLFRIDKTTTTKGTEDEPGTGIGLPICKEFAEKCGGKIQVESEVGKGSTFTIVLPK